MIPKACHHLNKIKCSTHFCFVGCGKNAVSFLIGHDFMIGYIELKIVWSHLYVLNYANIKYLVKYRCNHFIESFEM